MKKIIGIAVVLVLLSVGMLSGCTEVADYHQYDLEHVGVVKDCSKDTWATTVLFHDDTTFRFSRGHKDEFYLFCRNHKNDTIYLSYDKSGNHHTINEFHVILEE